jgi:DNA integrity scanning protein DisA with diadenylate cyclase activity
MPGTETERLQSTVYQVQQAFAHTRLLDWVDIAALVVIAYVLLTGLSRTRAWRMAWGLAVLLVVYWIAGMFLPVLRWAMYQALLPGVVGLMIIFQGDRVSYLFFPSTTTSAPSLSVVLSHGYIFPHIPAWVYD